MIHNQGQLQPVLTRRCFITQKDKFLFLLWKNKKYINSTDFVVVLSLIQAEFSRRFTLWNPEGADYHFHRFCFDSEILVL